MNNVAVHHRKKIVDNAVANEKLEQREVSDESKKIAQNYVVGKADAKKAAEQILKRYGVK